MSTITSKHTKRQAVIDPIFLLAILFLVLTTIIFAPINGNTFNPFGNMLGSFGNTSTTLSANTTVSFAYDQAYWDANCSHGWSADATCDVIVQRSQSCAISADSAYCAAYERYLQNFMK